MDKIKYFLIGMVFLANMAVLKAQETDKKQFKITILGGSREISNDSLADAADLDFMNYLHHQNQYSDYELAGFAFDWTINPTWELGLRILTESDLNPRELSLTAQYTHESWYGIRFSAFTYPQYIESFNQYHINNDAGYIADIDPNFRQVSISDRGFSVGPFVHLEHKRLYFNIRLNGGISWFTQLQGSIAQKELQSNLRREFRYQTKGSASLFISPEAEIGIDCFKISGLWCGFQLRGSLLYSKRSINYTRTLYNWTPDNSQSENITNPRHRYQKQEGDLGFYIRF